MSNYSVLRGTSETNFKVGLGTTLSPSSFEVLRILSAVFWQADALANSLDIRHIGTGDTTGAPLTILAQNGGTNGGSLTLCSGAGNSQTNAGNIDFRPGSVAISATAPMIRITGAGRLVVGSNAPLASSTHLIRSYNAPGGLIGPLTLQDGGNAGSNAFVGLECVDSAGVARFSILQGGDNKLLLKTISTISSFAISVGNDISLCILAAPGGVSGNLAILGVAGNALPSYNSGTGILAIKRATANPSANAPAGFGYLYIDQSTSELIYRGSATRSVLAPN